MDFGLNGKTAIVTGAAGDIGGAIARDLAREGVSLSLCYHRKKCDQLVEEIKKMDGDAIAVRADVTRADEIDAAVKATYEKFGRIDILVNNAGIGIAGSVENTTIEDWDRVMAINLTSVFLFSKAIIGYMKRQRWGRIINIGSVVAKNATNARPWLDLESSSKFGGGVYAASKSGVHTLTRTLAKELAPFGVTVNCVAPGPTKTHMLPSIPEALREQIPLGRIGNPEEISAFVVLLASERAGFVTGEIIDANGGLWMD